MQGCRWTTGADEAFIYSGTGEAQGTKPLLAVRFWRGGFVGAVLAVRFCREGEGR